MSSGGFSATFESLSNVVEGLPGGAPEDRKKVLNDLAERAAEAERAGLSDPRDCRSLFVDPVIDSQMAGVPLETYESVLMRLLKVNLLHTWVQVHCPLESGVFSDATILETDRAEEFAELAASPCPRCGQCR